MGEGRELSLLGNGHVREHLRTYYGVDESHVLTLLSR